MKTESLDRCKKLTGELNETPHLDAGAQGKVYLHGRDIVKEINLGAYAGGRGFTDNLTFRTEYEVMSMKKLSKSGFIPKFYGAWKCYDPNLKPKKDQITGTGKAKIIRKKGYYKAYIKMKRVRGVTLNKYLKKNNFTLRQLKELCDNIFKMNTKYDIIHTDIHFNNIMVCESKKMYIIDFGLAWRGKYDRRVSAPEDMIRVKNDLLSNRYVRLSNKTIERTLNGYIRKYKDWEDSTAFEIDSEVLRVSRLRSKDKRINLNRAFEKLK